ncbi:ABC transporter permease [Streptomyces sp. NPDC001165]|uniref:ABC transporter permease n=1 Tax=Streptomyces sp. NPDC001165 TaxID=3364546 RepID=UPI0036B153F4
MPGLFTQAIVNVGVFKGTTSLFEARRDQYIDDVFTSPLRWWEINAALVGGGIARGVVVGAGVLAVALPLTHGGTPARPLVLLFGTLGVLLVAALVGVIAGGHAKSLDHASAVRPASRGSVISYGSPGRHPRGLNSLIPPAPCRRP